MSGEARTSPAPCVVCAEDDPDIRLVLQHSLGTLAGFDLHLCEDGQAAVDLLRDVQAQLIVLDVMMPRCDGPQALKLIRDMPHHRRTPVVFLTARGMPNELEALLALGATGTILKPFDPLRLPSDLGIFIRYGAS
jgi:two-component system, OmpR family, response regulator